MADDDEIELICISGIAIDGGGVFVSVDENNQSDSRLLFLKMVHWHSLMRRLN